jgi:hypothetical protein
MLRGIKGYGESRQGGKEGDLDRRKIHVVVAGIHSVQSTNGGSAKRSLDTTAAVAKQKKVEVVRRQLRKALRELDQIEFELQGGCNW